jgi:hypothetical protein
VTDRERLMIPAGYAMLLFFWGLLLGYAVGWFGGRRSRDAEARRDMDRMARECSQLNLQQLQTFLQAQQQQCRRAREALRQQRERDTAPRVN